MDKWKELLEKAKTLYSTGSQLKSFATSGTTPEDLAGYMEEREKFIGSVNEFLKDMPVALEKQFEEINTALKTMKENVVSYKQPDKELTKADVVKAFMKATLFALKGESAFKSKDWQKDLNGIITPGSFMGDDFSRRNKFFTKDAVDSTLIPGGSNAGYTINPIYERELIKYGSEKSDMAPYVRRLAMISPQYSFPFLSGRTFNMTRTTGASSGITWNKANKIAAATTGPTFGERVTITTSTLAAYIPWIDEFADDLQINESLDSLMTECFLEAFGEDFDYNVLVADSSGTDAYDGVLNASGVREYTVAGSTPFDISPDEFDTALLTIPRVDRDGGYWILNETVVNALRRRRNPDGSYMFWTAPSGDMPGMIAGHPYIDAHLMPSVEELIPGDPFMAYARPENMWVGERGGLEVRQFDMTSYQLEYGENFTRWRLRNGFKIAKPAACLKLNLRTL